MLVLFVASELLLHRWPPPTTTSAATAAATHGVPLLQVAIIELPFGLVSSDSVGGAGGTCVIRGCVPKKLLVYA